MRSRQIQDGHSHGFGYQRVGVWGQETATQRIEYLGLMFGALGCLSRMRAGALGKKRDTRAAPALNRRVSGGRALSGPATCRRNR